MEMMMIWMMIPSRTGTCVSGLELITPTVCCCVCFFSLVNNTLIKIFSIFFFREMLCSCLGCSCQCVP